MRHAIVPSAVFAAALLLCAPAEAQRRGGQFEGFGGLTFGETASATTFGAGLAVPLGDHIQILGEAGRLSDVKPALLETALDLAPVDVRMAAWYAEGGLRVLGSRESAVRPYAQATAGVARLRPAIQGGGAWGAVANTALAYFGEAEPVVGAGAGVMLQGGPILLDLGYRYKRILAGSGVASAFALGNRAFEVNQVRVALGFRF